ncbi:hypothetical protein ACJIZ3_005001 [Penstemon smallii]|uniref:Myb/SANT-like domain-containing protein n=1 Tax=Penstemon smallii TaxID=265156 RepID=A0ABD3S3N3_9LAMI
MSGKNSASNHCSRTYWTPTMERYFVDLMLEHVDKGNRIGHTFNKQAWTDMLAVFNAKFGSQYDKDVLKGRYTNLWKVFNDIKNLLSQTGFSWDETKQMVVAEDHIWDAYIKIHPEDRSYRTKTVLNFNDLCLIYGYTVADGRYSLSSHDVDIEDDIQGQGVNFGDCSSGPVSSSSSRTEWTLDMDRYFIELMLNQKERGNKLDNTFTKQAWTDMLTLFAAKFGTEYNKRILRHRYKKLWKYYSDLLTLAGKKGFCWDEKQEMVVADDDIWDAHIKARPHARLYRGKVLPSFNSLGLIFEDMVSKENQIDSHQQKDITSDTIVGKSGSERSRTYWTPPMDNFLIELMLEQVRGGNRIGQSFITQAWNEMVESFNTNFDSHYDKEVLKNRYKHFRKQYNDVRILLQHNGFSWDESREMVTAEDHVWDSYIKAHPDARSYRVKTMPWYYKLCFIYGDGSHLVDGINVATETPCMKIDDVKKEEFLAGVDMITDWTAPMERYFFDLMLEQIQQGNKIDNAFDEQSWAQMTLLFKEKFGPQYEHHILENRYLTLMKQYIEITNLLNQKGFLWDESLQMIIADNNTWESYTKEQPEAMSYKDKVLGNYNELCTIFGTNELVDGELSFDIEMEFDQIPIDIKIDEYSGDLAVTVLEDKSRDQQKKRSPPSSMERYSKAQKMSKNEVEGNLTNVPSVITKLVKESGNNNNYGSVEKAIDALQAIPHIDDEVLLDGCDLLEDERKAKTFLALDASLRKKWLLRNLQRL